MNDQNETTQLRFLEETAIRLRQNGFTVEPIEDHHLPVCWEKGRLCRVSGKGSVLYRQENVDSIRAQDALRTVIDTAKMTSEYMAILETAPRLKASGLAGDYRVLADFGDAVLAGHPTERGVQFVTWEWDFDRQGVHAGHYFMENYEAAKLDFAARAGLINEQRLFSDKELGVIRNACEFALTDDATLTYGDEKRLHSVQEQIELLLPQQERNQHPTMEQTMATTWSLEKPWRNTVPITTHTTVGYRKLSMMVMPTGRYTKEVFSRKEVISIPTTPMARA